MGCPPPPSSAWLWGAPPMSRVWWHFGPPRSTQGLLRVGLLHVPQVLILLLGRFAEAPGGQVKDRRPIKLNQELMIPRIERGSPPARFLLRGGTAHIGLQTTSGHYRCFTVLEPVANVLNHPLGEALCRGTRLGWGLRVCAREALAASDRRVQHVSLYLCACVLRMCSD